MTRDLADVRNRVEQLRCQARADGPKYRNTAGGRAGWTEDVIPAPQTQPKLTPAPETRPTTIAGWMLREVVDGTAVLQGPNGIWRVTRGDTVPGVGRVNSIVRWGNRWIVSTTKGYCKSVPPNHTAEDGICKPYRAN